MPLRQASKSRHEPPQLVQAARPARAGCTRVRNEDQSPRDGSGGALLGASSDLFADGLLPPPARNEGEPSRSRPGTDDDLRCGSWAAVPAARPRRRHSRFSHCIPVVDEVQDDEADEGADVDEHVQPEATAGPRTTRAGSQPLVTDRRTQPGEPHERALQDATSSRRELMFPARTRGASANARQTRAARCAHAGEPPPGSPERRRSSRSTSRTSSTAQCARSRWARGVGTGRLPDTEAARSAPHGSGPAAARRSSCIARIVHSAALPQFTALGNAVRT